MYVDTLANPSLNCSTVCGPQELLLSTEPGIEINVMGCGKSPFTPQFPNIEAGRKNSSYNNGKNLAQSYNDGQNQIREAAYVLDSTLKRGHYGYSATITIP